MMTKRYQMIMNLRMKLIIQTSMKPLQMVIKTANILQLRVALEAEEQMTKKSYEEDDESFHEDEFDENEDVDDVGNSDDDDEDYEYSSRRTNSRKGRKTRGRSRSNNYAKRREIESFIVKDENDFDDDEDDDTISYSSSRRRGRSTRNYAENNYNKYQEDDNDRAEATNIRRSRRLRSTSMQNDEAPFLKRRTRSAMNAAENEFNNQTSGTEALTLQDEIRELRESSPIREFKGGVVGIEKGPRSLRERTKHVNYKIPPPLADPGQDVLSNDAHSGIGAGSNAINTNALRSSYTSSPSRRGRGASSNKFPQRRLFPTGGPFGGNEVTSIFGENTVFYNLDDDINLTSLPKFTLTQSMDKYKDPSTVLNSTSGDVNGNQGQNNNKRLIDSDSSEDEILPMGAKPKTKDPNTKKKKKKPEIADLDPLGVDMNINFDDVGGLDNYIDQLKEMITLPLLYPELYQNFNITPPRGVLFHGPPGTGKTLMARALAASCSSDTRKITFFMRKGADILSKWVGEAERQLRLLFEEAKKHQPSIIFFDEIDGLAPVRSSKQEQIHASIVSTMLALMDGMDNRGQVIVIGATNRPDAVDPALRRPGRFDREFYFPLPDIDARAKILEIHTRKWNPPLQKPVILQLANLTKGYGGADLRALCTEAALISIQHKYPQIYRSNDKLDVDPSKITVSTSDFMLALEKIVPSSARSTGNIAQPLPEPIKPLLDIQLGGIERTLNKLIPKNDNQFDRSKSLIQQFIEYEDFDENNTEGHGVEDFEKHSLISSVVKLRVSKPRLLISGPPGNGQQYIGSAILNVLEKYNIQKLDLASLVSDSSRTLEAAVVQTFVEARKRQPAVIYIPNLDIWCRTIPENVIMTLATLLGSLENSEKILLLGIGSQLESSLIDSTPLGLLGFSKKIFELKLPNQSQRVNYFKSIEKLLSMQPTSFNLRKKRTTPLPKLPHASPDSDPNNLDENGVLLSTQDILRRKLRKFQYQDMRLKNVLKIKLSGIMDLILKRYRRFKKPAVDDMLLVHLFEPVSNDPNWEAAYVKDKDMILEVATGKKFFNMDLDIVEERLWNGFYSDPRQFLRDIEYIYHDASVLGDRENTIRASEMFANAQMAIEDISTKEFIDECKATHQRDLERQKLFLEDQQKRLVQQQEQNEQILKEIQESVKPSVETVFETPVVENGITEVGVGSGNQLQAQMQINAVLSPVEDTIIKGTEIENNSITKDENFAQEDNLELLNKENENNIENGNSTAPVNEKKQDNVILDNYASENGETVATNQGGNGKVEIKAIMNETASVDISTPSTAPATDSMPEPVTEHVAELALVKTEASVPEPVKKMVDDRVVIVDSSAMNDIMDKLIKISDGFTVSQLEELYAEIVDIVWEDRDKWEKANTISKIKKYLNI
ncbi:hypothetical protein TPHA_0L02210 [Tetrapisispora phaffii CBS 4417]|uniref:Bromo domain-containing protein n=1 Tax=Tetrapisispora phaffii (strain ATCC 24235 / CBS 4417 / NBRC 1672 / NRRL Y-8282 / UCD 70-5) TaxID=1071381 RepID=G8C094_TETPH|nr:hypothetical protein TPHA_0L02210 [Tetrapisispora phaffii CBS 4417]CCE65572.1 hypothetical protein TPHA_0L02210 [Tetrapisispora phaffii CBS 4417]